MNTQPTLTIDHVDSRRIEGERNLLDLARKAGIDIPTFCYHSQLSIYGACRLCLVDVEGRGIVASCSTPPEAGLPRPHAHRRNPPDAKHRPGADPGQPRAELPDLREKHLLPAPGPDAPPGRRPTCASSPRTSRSRSIAPASSLVRNPNKCILCGDCVRACEEIQGIGVIDFAYRGAASAVVPAFGKNLKRRGVRQLRAVRHGLPDRRPYAAIGNRRGLEGAEQPEEDGRRPDRPGRPRGPGRGLRHASRQHRDRPHRRGTEAHGLQGRSTTRASPPT